MTKSKVASVAVDSAPAVRQEAMGGLAKGLAILESFGRAAEQMSVTDAARVSNTTPAAARRCLLTLTDLGYLAYDGKYFRPTPRLAGLARAYTRADPVVDLGQAVLDRVRDRLDLSASLAVLDRGEVVFTARSEAARVVVASVKVGSHLPVLFSGIGRVLAKDWTETEVKAAWNQRDDFKLTDHAPDSVDQILVLLRRVREDGYAFTDEELEYGVRTFAVPVTREDGSTAAAMAVSAFASTRLSLDDMVHIYVPVLKEEAARLALMLGERDPRPD